MVLKSLPLALAAGLSLVSTAQAAKPQPAPAPTSPWKLVPMATGRYAPTATVLPNGKVLVAGGYNGSTSVTSAQLFDPATNAFSTTGSLKAGRNFATATLINDGKVLVAGGFHPFYGSLNSAELYDPTTGGFTLLSTPMKQRRELYTATKLLDGKVLLVGGLIAQGFVPLRSTELFDPATSTFEAASDLVSPHGRFGHDAILLDLTEDGLDNPTKVLIVGGKEITADGVENVLKSVEMYDIRTGTFTLVGEMAESRDRPTLAWSSSLGKVVILGGQNKAVDASGKTYFYGVKRVEYFDPLTLTFNFGPSLKLDRMAHAITALPSDRFLVTGGWSDSLTLTVSTKRSSTTTKGNTTASAEVFSADASSPTGGSFTDLPLMNYSRHDHGAVRLGDGRVLVVGGKRVEHGASSYPPYAEIYTP